MSARQELADYLAPLLPGWKIVASFRPIDTIERPTVRIGLKSLAPHAEAGYGTARTVTGTITVASHLRDFAKAEDQLDNNLLPALLEAIEAHPTVIWTDAEMTKWQADQLAYDVQVTFTTTEE